MKITHRFLEKFIGQHIHCYTHFGTFRGVIVHCTKRHIILSAAPRTPYMDPTWSTEEMSDARPFLSGPWGPGGPGYGPGPGPGYGPGPGFGPGPGPGHGPGPGPGPGWGGGGGGWGFAIPLAAILGVTAIGMHWW
jgi:hypothetical protein